MRKPSTFVRHAGSPVAATALILGGAWLIIAWAQGHAPSWAALLGLIALGKAISSARRMKLYNAWLKEWNAVGTFGKEQPKPKARPLRTLTFTAAWLFVAITGYAHQIAGRPHLLHLVAWIWLGCGLFLLARLVAGVRRLISKRRDRIGKSDAAPVSWMLGATMDSPSRESAERRLPEYAARVLTAERVTAGVVMESHN